jgi:protein O-mannosyl-transferase
MTEKRALASPFLLVLLGALSIFAAVWLIYWPALHGTWLWDDGYEIASNPLLSDPDGLVKIWRGEGALDYFPLKATLQWLLWRVWGANSTAWHALNIALHGVTALLLWRLLWRLGVRHAWFGAALFAAHPLAVESVAWMAELKNLLALAFVLTSFLVYLDYDENPRSSRLCGATLLFTAAMLCKSTVVMLPCILALFLWWKHGAAGARRLFSLIPFFVIAITLGLVTMSFQHQRAIGQTAIPVGDLDARIARGGLAIIFYTWKALWPVDLMPVYPRWQLEPLATHQLLAWPAIGCLFGWLWWRRTKAGRDIIFAAGTFLLSLIPILGFIGMAYMHASWVADHFAYPALPAVAGLFAGGVGMTCSLLRAWQWEIARSPCAAILVSLAALSWSYAGNFRNAAALWTHAVKANPGSAVAHNNLAIELARLHRFAAARAHFEVALRLDPQMRAARENLHVLETEVAGLVE